MKRSALFHLHQVAGATFVERHGWEMPLSFASPELEGSRVREQVGLADLSYRAKFDSKTAPSRPSWSLGRNHFLIVGEPPLSPPAGTTDVTSVYAELLLAGPSGKAVLSKLTSLNLSDAVVPNLSCAQASLAHAHTIFLREDIGPIPGFHLLISREYAQSAWEAIAHAGREFQLQPFGLGALELLRN
jgi:glycine cleavage system aminomethyltransferase T